MSWITPRRLAAGAVLSALLVSPVLAAAQEKAPAPSRPSYRIPYRITDTKHLLVRARVNGKGPFHFIVDTGAPAIFITKEAAKRCGLAAGPDGWGEIAALDVEGGLRAEKVLARAEDLYQFRGMNSMGLAGMRIDGVFGYHFLARYRMEIDPDQPTMRWTEVGYQPQPLPSLEELSPDKPIDVPEELKGMEGLTQIAAALLGKRPEPKVVARGFLGLELAGMAAPALVRATLPDSPARKAGLLRGDRIQAVTVGGKARRVTKGQEVHAALSSLKAGQKAYFTLSRKGKTLKVPVTAAGGGF
ncbi:MAG: retroviral-like aspartic protease family protein [Armatimonadota bacterium]